MTDPVEVVVGVVGRPHGVRGEVVVEPRTDEPARRFAVGATLRSEDGRLNLTLSSVRDHGAQLLARFEGYGDRTAVEALRGLRLVVQVNPDETPEADEEYYDRQLVGLRVLDSSGSDVGVVAGVVHAPQQDLLEVQIAEGLRLVPFVTALVPEVDLASGRLRLADFPGLLDDAT